MTPMIAQTTTFFPLEKAKALFAGFEAEATENNEPCLFRLVDCENGRAKIAVLDDEDSSIIVGWL